MEYYRHLYEKVRLMLIVLFDLAIIFSLLYLRQLQ